jgi:hypothetical protein
MATPTATGIAHTVNHGRSPPVNQATGKKRFATTARLAA